MEPGLALLELVQALVPVWEPILVLAVEPVLELVLELGSVLVPVLELVLEPRVLVLALVLEQ